MTAMMQPLLLALASEETKRKADDLFNARRREYIGLLASNDPAKAPRVLELAREMGHSAEAVKADLAAVQSGTAAQPATAAKPAVDTSKMNGSQLLAHAVAGQNAAMPKASQPIIPPFNPATANTNQLLREGMRGQTPRMPQEAF